MQKIPPPHLIPLVTSMDMDHRTSPVTVALSTLVVAALVIVGMLVSTGDESAPRGVVEAPCAEQVAR
jgi:hypothetical protein